MPNIFFSFQSSLLYGTFLFHWRSNGSFPALCLCVSPVFWYVSRRRLYPIRLDFAKTIQTKTMPSILTMHSLYPCEFSLQLFMFSLHFSKCRSLALCVLISDEIVVMDNPNSITCLAWPCRIQHLSLLCGAFCRHPKTSDTNLCLPGCLFLTCQLQILLWLALNCVMFQLVISSSILFLLL